MSVFLLASLLLVLVHRKENSHFCSTFQTIRIQLKKKKQGDSKNKSKRGRERIIKMRK